MDESGARYRKSPRPNLTFPPPVTSTFRPATTMSLNSPRSPSVAGGGRRRSMTPGAVGRLNLSGSGSGTAYGSSLIPPKHNYSRTTLGLSSPLHHEVKSPGLTSRISNYIRRNR